MSSQTEDATGAPGWLIDILAAAGTAAVVVFLSLAIYGRTHDYGFLDRDDNTIVEQNPYILYPTLPHTLDLFVLNRTPGPFQPIRNALETMLRVVERPGATQHDHDLLEGLQQLSAP